MKSKVAIRKHYFRESFTYDRMKLEDFLGSRKAIFEDLKKSLDFYLKGLGYE